MKKLLFLILIVFLFSCKKDKSTPPIITTTAMTEISCTTATSGGAVTDDGGASVTARGVCWNTSLDPTVANSKTTDGTGTGIFTSSITGLTPGATYYLKAYAINSVGTGYSSQSTFTTLASAPILTTTQPYNITTSSVTSGGNITNDGGSPVITRGVYLTSQNPKALSTKTTDGTGTGSYTSSITNLTAGTTYYIRAYATNSVGMSYGNQITFTSSDYPDCGTVTDEDGNVYKTVTIGTQCWLRENLKTTKYKDGTAITLRTVNNDWLNQTSPAYCWYNNAAANKDTYGALYNWYTVNTGKLCPTGWHVPNNTEWATLTTYLGGITVAGGKLKEAGTNFMVPGSSHWVNSCCGSIDGTNETGFTALPGGGRYANGIYIDMGYSASWWSSDGAACGVSFNSSNMGCGGCNVGHGGCDNSGHSVRCVQD